MNSKLSNNCNKNTNISSGSKTTTKCNICNAQVDPRTTITCSICKKNIRIRLCGDVGETAWIE